MGLWQLSVMAGWQVLWEFVFLACFVALSIQLWRLMGALIRWLDRGREEPRLPDG